MKTWVKILLAATGAVLLASWGAFFTAPLDLKDGLELLQMRLHGVRDVRSGGLHALFKDDCRPGLPCACVALIHGLGDSSIRWHKTLLTTDEQWREAGLKDTALKLYAFDLPGVGSSDAPAQFADYRVRTIARTLRGAMEPLCPSWIVVGNSLGGWISEWLALDWREGVDKLILLDAAGMKIGIDDPTAALFLDPTPEKMRDFTAKLFYKPPSIPDWVYPRISDRLRKRHVVEIIEAQQAEDFIEPVASSIHRPTMVLWGEADRMLPVEMGKTLAQLIPGAIFRELPKCGHLPQSECPREVTRAIVDMVKLGRF